MDRISDSGSDGCGSIPHGGTKKGSALGLNLLCYRLGIMTPKEFTAQYMNCTDEEILNKLFG